MRIDQNLLVEKKEVTIGTDKGSSVSTETTSTAVADSVKSRSVLSMNVDKGQFMACSSWEEVMAQADSVDADQLKDQMAMLSNTMTSKDYQEMQEQGFSIEDTDVKTIVTVMDQIKMTLMGAGVDISCFGDLPSSEKVAQMSGSTAQAMRLEHALQEQNLPATDSNLQDGTEALNQASTLTTPDEASKKYMIDNQLDPTIENLYKAQHATSGTLAQSGETSLEWDGMEQQMQQVIEQSQCTSTEDPMEMSKWLVQQDIPLTPENLEALDVLNQLQLPAESETVIESITTAISEGLRPANANLSGTPSNLQRAADAKTVIEEATDEDVKQVIDAGKELTVENLKWASQSQTDSGSESESEEYTEEDAQLLTAKRQLEETRLSMTIQANYSLLKQGIQIETQPLQDLVEQLKGQENSYYESLLQSQGLDGTVEEISLYKDTTQTVDTLKELPAAVLGTQAFQIPTIQSLYESGLQVQTNLATETSSIVAAATGATSTTGTIAAISQYETLMTTPRADLGDNIQKAFQNVDDILSDLSLETTQANERAVRILAYNQTDITIESVATMKVADSQVQQLLKNMTPAVTMQFIKNGINPLETEIPQLNEQISQMKEETGGDDQKFSEYLWNLEHTEGISETDRDAYIGVYRLLNQVEKTDGAVVGALVEQGASLTMKNLLTGVKTRQNSGIDVSVDESFGTVEQLEQPSSTIADQLAKGFHTNSTMERTYVDNVAEYEKSCAKQAEELLNPQSMLSMYEENAQVGQTIEEFFGNQTSEQLLEQLQRQSQNVSEEYTNEQLSQLESCAETEESVLKLLSDHGITTSVTNIMAANNYFQNRNKLYQQLLENGEEDDSLDVDFAGIKEDLIKRFAEALESPTEMAKAQETLAEVAENAMKGMLPAEKNIQSLDVKNLKLMRKELQLNTQLAKDEQYAIPVLVEDELATVHLKIVRADDEKGKVNVIFDTNSLGKIAAELVDSGKQIDGLIVSDQKETTQMLKENSQELATALGSDEKSVRLSYITQEELDLTNFEISAGNSSDNEDKDNQVQTVDLYKMAKAFLSNVIKVSKDH